MAIILKKKIFLSPKPLVESNIQKKESKIFINISELNTLSFLPKQNTYRSRKNREIKKIKKIFSKKNLIQLNNMNNKVYEEDFNIRDNKSKYNILKPQISVRLTLFSNKNHFHDKYYFVNFFYSENIKNKPLCEESDF